MKSRVKYDLVVDARMLGYAGIGVYLEQVLIRVIKGANYKILLLVYKQYINFFENKYSTTNILSNVSYRQVKFGVYNPMSSIELMFKIPSCSLYWTPHFNTVFLPLYRVGRRVVTIHDLFHLANRSYYSFHIFYFIKTWYFVACILSDTIITVSNFSKSELKKYIGINPYNKSKVIYNAVISDELTTNIILSDNTKNLKVDKILFVGSLKPHKNLLTLIYAFKELLNDSSYKKTELIIVGKLDGLITSITKELLDDIQNHEQIKVMGFVEDSQLIDLYKSSTILVFPSIYEGFGLPILEAYKYKLPSIISDIPVFREIACDASLFFNTLDSNSLLQKIKLLLKSTALQHKLINKGLNRLDIFSWENSYKEHAKIFNKFIKY